MFKLTCSLYCCLAGCCLFLIVYSAQCQIQGQGQGNSWAEVKKTGKGKIKIYWYESRPFIYKDETGEMKGIEEEILTGFKEYVREKYNVELT